MAEVDLSLLELDLIGAALALDVRRFPLIDVPWHGELLADRARLAEAAHRGLAARGLLRGPRLAPDLERLVTAYARAPLSVALSGSTHDRPYRARAGVLDSVGVLVDQRGERVRLRPFDPAGLVGRVLALVPTMRPGPGPAVTITAPDTPARRRVEDEDFAGETFLEQVRPVRDSAGQQWEAVRRIFDRPRLGSGYAAVFTRDARGQDGEPVTVSWLDTDAGRYLALPERGPDGRLHVSYAPADHARLAQTLERLVSRVLRPNG
jgi:ESX secretion-associated protein EspG